MTNISSDELTIGYCTNVHAGIDLPSIRENLDKYAVPVQQQLSPLLAAESDTSDANLGVGLWIPNAASQELSQADNAAAFGDFLRQRNLSAYTINGFPFDNFHQDIVKHQVYLPTWSDRSRLEYTQRLANILSAILPTPADTSVQSVGSISTLPIGWPNHPQADNSKADQEATDETDPMQVAGQNFRSMAEHLAKIESATGKRIVVAIEPEPGCILDTTDDVITFFESQLPESLHRRYINVCHDVCHSAVMMESQAKVITRLAKAGIGIGKVQVSSAIVADWESMADGRRIEALKQLADFAEDRYLHQTGRRKSDGTFQLAEDLPALIASCQSSDGTTSIDDHRWVVHFHVPVFLERFGHLATSHQEVLEVLRTLLSDQTSIDFTGHLEVETYAWTVLPAAMRKRGLAEDIAEEIQWLRKAIVMVG
ncbi:MAG: metabolite traffic protein EboE [Pirellulaceae bacterium]